MLNTTQPSFRKKVKRGMTENALKAKSNGVHLPFGYYVDDTDHYQIDETSAPRSGALVLLKHPPKLFAILWYN